MPTGVRPNGQLHRLGPRAHAAGEVNDHPLALSSQKRGHGPGMFAVHCRCQAIPGAGLEELQASRAACTRLKPRRMRTCVTAVLAFADVSTKRQPFDFANAAPSWRETSRSESRSTCTESSCLLHQTKRTVNLCRTDRGTFVTV
jgi:hypothetical protein